MSMFNLVSQACIRQIHSTACRLTVNLHTSWCIIIPFSILEAQKKLLSFDLESVITGEENNHPSSEIIPKPPSIRRRTRIGALDSWNRDKHLVSCQIGDYIE